MTTRMPDRSATARVVELAVADEREAWESAGFTVDGDLVHLGTTTVRLTGRDDLGTGITGWILAGVPDPGHPDLDGLPTLFERGATDEQADVEPTAASVPHPNGVTGIDHIVVFTPDLERTIDAFRTIQLPCRRIRDTGSDDAPMQQAFFRCGPVIIEVVGPTTGSGETAEEAPATWFGLALDADDLDRVAALLGDGVGRIKPAVQRGRRITTFRHRTFDISTTLAAMDDHADRLVDPASTGDQA
jgi:catechol 2,3-dioxygenase-like lactoylglutathione lyase family enzyme